MSTNNNQYGKEVKPKWKNPAAETSKITKLSGAKLQSMVSNDLSAYTALTLSKRGITKIEDLAGFSDLLHRLDLSDNAITRLHGFNVTPGISMLNVSSNELSGDASLEDLRYLTELRTLNIGNNPNIKYIRSHVAKPLQKLQALIGHECGFEKVSFLKFIPNLNTLILSKNSISDFSLSEVGSLVYLTKLSIGKNMLKTVPDLSASVNLTELRINNNLLTSLSDGILLNKKLKTLDISNNLLSDWSDIRKLVGLPHLTNLGVKGNKFPSPPDSTDDLEVREDKAAESIDDITERRFRRFVLSIFLRNVGAANKSFEQLIVLDMKRVKMKLSPGMSSNTEIEEDQEEEMPTQSSGKNKLPKKISMDASTLSPKKTKKRLLSDVDDTPPEKSESSKSAEKKKKRGSDKIDEENFATNKDIKKKKKSGQKIESESFLGTDEGSKKEKKSKKSGKETVENAPSSSSSSSTSTSNSSGVLAVIVHKKMVKSNGKAPAALAVTPGTDGSAEVAFMGGTLGLAVGIGGDSAW